MFNIDNDSKKYLLKSCAALYKENCRLYVNFQSKTESKMVIFAQMKPKLYNYVVKRESDILKTILLE